ncbi:MAG TPA: DNA polymerase IV [Solirubrobacterales bacterium]|nr:DNA polymerase IV [Solirubrobacterales bacterium]
MLEEATIIHADVDSFFASVHQRDDPALRGKPVAVGPGIVMAATYEARAFGVRSAMPAEKARLLCPELIVVEADFDSYVKASRQLFRVFRDTAPVVEGMSLEEAFLDVRGLGHIAGSPVEIAIELRRRVREEIGLPLSVGIARTKGVAKMASKTSKPEGLLAVSQAGELPFLHPIRVEYLWGVGASTAARLHAAGVETVGQVAAMTREELESILGRAGARSLHAFALGRDPRRVRIGSGRRSVGAQRGLGLSRLRAGHLDATLVSLVDRVTHRMRKGGHVGRTVVLRLRFGDYKRATRSRTLSHATAGTEPILAAARSLAREAIPEMKRRGVTMVGITVQGLGDGAAVQLELPLGRSSPALDEALDQVRERFGTGAVTRGRA